jgi:hypothetical protein
VVLEIGGESKKIVIYRGGKKKKKKKKKGEGEGEGERRAWK